MADNASTRKMRLMLSRIFDDYCENFNIFESVLDKFYPGEKLCLRIKYLETKKESVYNKFKASLMKGVDTFDLTLIIKKLSIQNNLHSGTSNKNLATLTTELSKINKELLALERIDRSRHKNSLKI